MKAIILSVLLAATIAMGVPVDEMRNSKPSSFGEFALSEINKPRPPPSNNNNKKPGNNAQIGGAPADVMTAFTNQFPEVFYIMVGDSVPCQGALITNKTILTAASCFWNIAGENNTFTTDPTKIKIGQPGSLKIMIDPTIEVFNVTINPYYRYYPLSKVHENNLAIVTLKKIITKVPPVQLTGSDKAKPDSYSKVTGALIASWGQITNPSDVKAPSTTNVLKFANVTVASQKACFAQYAALNASSVYLLADSMLCTNLTTTRTTTCQGDEGAGLRYLDTSTYKPVLFAIASPPIETQCPTTLHSIYTNVGTFSQWINGVTGLKNK